MQIYLVRHGETDWNREMKFQGWADIALNEAGRAQARALAARLKPIPIDAAFCSDLRRAQETAEILLPGRKTPLQPDPLLREMNFGPLEGKPCADARANPESPVHLLFTDPGQYAPPQEEYPTRSIPVPFWRHTTIKLRIFNNIHITI